MIAIRQSRAQVIPFAALLALADAAACGGDGDTDTPNFAPEVADFDMQWRDNVHIVNEAEGKELLTGDPPTADTLSYTFDPSASTIAALAPGDIAVLSGVAYRRVVAVTDTGTGIQLDTERITLPDAVMGGTLDWVQTISFGPESTSRLARVSVGGRPVADMRTDAAAPLTWEGEVSGYDISLTLTPSEGRLDIEAVASLEVLGERRFALEATGHIESFQSIGHAEYSDAGGLSFEVGQTEVRGDLRVHAVAVNTGLSDKLLDIPIGVDIPIDVGPVPMLLKIKANINVLLILGISDSTAEADVSFHFSSDQGIAVSGSVLSATGALSTGDLSGFLGGSADFVAAGMSACVEFPRFELATLGEFASVGITQNNCATTDFTFDPACNEVNGSITGFGLANLGFFGFSVASEKVELYHREDGHHAGMCEPSAP